MAYKYLLDLARVFPGLPREILEATEAEILRRIGLARQEPPAWQKPRVCPICKTEYVPTHGKQMYCSPPCKKRGNRMGKTAIKRRLKSDVLMRRCQGPGCSESLIGQRRDAKYCSDACKMRAARLRQKTGP